MSRYLDRYIYTYRHTYTDTKNINPKSALEKQIKVIKWIISSITRMTINADS